MLTFHSIQVTFSHESVEFVSADLSKEGILSHCMDLWCVDSTYCTTGHTTSGLLYSLLHCTVLHHTSPHHTTPHHTTPHYTTPHYTTPHYTTPHHTTPHYTTPHYTTLHYTHHTTPHCTTPHYTFPLKKLLALSSRVCPSAVVGAEKAFRTEDGPFDVVFNLAAETKYGQAEQVQGTWSLSGSHKQFVLSKVVIHHC